MNHAVWEADLCVVGGGLAGLSAAVRGTELGLRVLVLEGSAEQAYLCNSRMTNGMFHLALTSVLSSESQLDAALRRATHGLPAPDVVAALAAHAQRGVRWLQCKGIRFMKASAQPHQNFTLAPPALHRTGPFDIQGRGGDVMLRKLEAALVRGGGRMLRGHRARQLRVAQGRCTGVCGLHADAPFEVRAGGVVLADGGFQANPDLMQRFGLTQTPAAIVQRNARTGVGDGVRMAEEAGARLSDMLGFYGHLQCRDALTNDALWPYPWLDLLAAAGLLVNARGERFADEGRGGVFMANRVAALHPGDAWVVFDRAIWEGPGRAYVKAPNPRLVQRGGTVLVDTSLEGLALQAGIDSRGLCDTVERHNTAVRDSGWEALSPLRSCAKLPALALETGPFMAVPAAAGITHTMGGVLIDGWSRALQQDGTVFNGLYAAGSASGGIEGGLHAGYVGGLIKALVTGLRAAECAAGGASCP